MTIGRRRIKNNSTTGINLTKYDQIPVHVEGDAKPTGKLV